jgi:acyl-CoA dehydrogenase
MALDADVLEQFIDQVKRLVTEKLVPNEERLVEDDDIPDEIVDDLKDLGFFGLSIPEEYGGLGLCLTDEAKIMMEFCQSSVAYRSRIGTNNGIGSQGLVIDGNEQQKQQYLPGLASGEMIASFALTEPGAGSDAGSLTTSAVRDGDHYLLNGTKRFITNAPQADLFTVMARTDATTPGARGVSAFIVEADTPGITLGKKDKKMGQRGAHTSDVIFENCRIPATARIGDEGHGFKTAMKVLDRGRLHISAVCIGQAERLLKDSLNYAIERKQFGERIADFQLIQAMLADSRTEIYAARSMLLDATSRYDQGERVSEEASCCKMFASEMVGRIADRAVQIHGGAGYMADYAVERFYRDVRLFRIYEGTTQIQQLVIAKSMIRSAENS